jgi:hypothetical protein
VDGGAVVVRLFPSDFVEWPLLMVASDVDMELQSDCCLVGCRRGWFSCRPPLSSLPLTVNLVNFNGIAVVWVVGVVGFRFVLRNRLCLFFSLSLQLVSSRRFLVCTGRM